MQKLILKLSPILCLLLFFSCAKDNELTKLEDSTEILQARERGEPESPCNMTCKQPDFVQISNITGCTAKVTWGFEADYCGTYIVHMQNMTTGNWTFFDPATSPLSLWNLDHCTEYTVGISHVTDICASVPLEVTFKTTCERCECNINCKTPDFAFVEEIGDNAAVIKFGFDQPGKVCGHFIAFLKNNDTGIETYIDPATSPLVLSGLSECTSYTIGISHVTDLQACVPTELHFSTPCDDGPCEAEGLNSTAAYLDEIFFGQNNTLVGYFYNTNTAGYVMINNPIVELQPNTYYDIAFCFHVAPAYDPASVNFKVWIDFDGDNHFELNELATEYSNPSLGSSCVGPSPTLAIPTQEICRVRGRAIISINNGEILSPCEDVPLGQVIDFWVDIGDCDAHN